MKKLNKFWLIMVVVLVVMVLAVPTMMAKAKINAKVTRRPVGKFGGTLITSVLQDPKTFNIVTTKDNSSTQAITWLYEGFQEVDGVTTAIEPALAEKWSFSKDGLVWTFTIREGVTWHDGQPFTADDVIFTFDVIYDEKVPTSSRDVLQVEGKPLKVEKVDNRTVRVTLPAPFAPLLLQMPTFIPKHKLYEAWKAGKFNEANNINTDPKALIGTGPWRMVEYKPGERMVYERYNNYWKVDKAGNQLSYLDRWVAVICPSLETQSLKFKSGETDSQAVRAEEWKMYLDGQKAGNYTCYDAGPTFSTNFVVFNMNPNAPVFKNNQTKFKWFNNQKFRQALAYAIDKQTMIKNVFKGLAEEQWSPISVPNKVYLNTKVKKYEYNLSKAQSALAQAGFIKDKSGVLHDPEGNVVKFSMETNAGNNQREMMMQIIAEDWKKLGIQVNATPVDFNLMLDHLMTNYDWDVILIGLTGGLEPNNGRNVWHSSGQLHMWWPTQEKAATPWEARIDEIFDKGVTYMNVKDRVKLYNEYQMIISEQVPLIFLVAPKSLFAVRNKLKNVQPTAYGGVFHNMPEVYIQ